MRYRPEAPADRVAVGQRARQVLALHIPCSGQLADIQDRGLHLMVEEIRASSVDGRHVRAPGKLEVLKGFVSSDEAPLGFVACHEPFDDRCVDGIFGAPRARLLMGIQERSLEPHPEGRAEPRIRLDRGGVSALDQVHQGP
jgi:hypothetical protein